MSDQADYSRYQESNDVGFARSKEAWLKKFKQYDRNRNGVIECWEFKRFLFAMGLCPTDKEVKDKLKNDFNKSGNDVISFEEFYEWIQKQDNPSEELRQAFELFDKDKNGYLDKEEFKYVMASFSDPDTLNSFFSMVDDDNDGKIGYKEFLVAFAESDDEEEQKRTKR